MKSLEPVRYDCRYEDGPNADKMGHDYKVTITDIDHTRKMAIRLAPGGGWAARIYLNDLQRSELAEDSLKNPQRTTRRARER